MFEQEQVRLDHGLKVRSPHFDVVDAWRRVEAEGGVSELVRERIRFDLLTAIHEDLLGAGSFSLKFIEGDDGIVRFTHPTYPDDDLLEMGEYARQKALANGRDARREDFELYGVARLRRLSQELESGERIFWTSYPGSKEAGYVHQTSMTYVAEVIEPGKEIRVNYLVSSLDLRGHGKLYTHVADSLPVLDADFFLSSVVNTSKTSAEVFGMVDHLVSQGYENPEADLSGHVGEQLAASSYEQIAEAGEFLANVYSSLFVELRGRSFSQDQVDSLERAYEMAYKSITKHARGKGKLLVSRSELMNDFRKHQEILLRVNDFQLPDYELMELRREAWGFMCSLDDRYGLHGVVMGGVGCAGGESIGLGIEFGQFDLIKSNGLLGMFQAESMISAGKDRSKWEWKKGNCVSCSAKSVECGPCGVCRTCQLKFDRGDK